MKIECIADRLEMMDTLAKWHEHEWGREWAQQVRESTCKGKIPTVYIATEGDELIGSCMLVSIDMTTRTDLTPWLGGVFVNKTHRGQGVATMLVSHAMDQARKMEIGRLWLYTASSRKLYEHLGWQYVSEADYENEKVTIMQYVFQQD